MTLEQYAYIAEIVGVIVIAVTLVYLVVEVRQNTQALHSQTRQNLLATAHALLHAQVEHPDIIVSMLKDGQLDQEENIKLNAWLVSLMRHLEFAWQQYKNGIIDEDRWSTERRVLDVVLRGTRNREWWEQLGRPVFNEEFCEFVDAEVRGRPPTDELLKGFLDWANASTEG